MESVACLRQLAWDAAGVHNRGVLKSAALLYSEWRLKLERILILETTDVALNCLGRTAPRPGGIRPRARGGGSSKTGGGEVAQRSSTNVFDGRHDTDESGAFEEVFHGESGVQNVHPGSVQSGGSGPSLDGTTHTNGVEVLEVVGSPPRTVGVDLRSMFARQSQTGEAGVPRNEQVADGAQPQTGGSGVGSGCESFSEERLRTG